MTKKISALIITVSIFVPGLAMSEDMAPPSGPYTSIEDNKASSFAEQKPEWVKQRQIEMNNWVEQQSQKMETFQNSNNSQEPEVPGWVKKNQAEMEQQMMQYNNQAAHAPMQVPSQARNQAWGQPPAQWNAQKQPAYPQANNQHFMQSPANRMQPYFPAARGPVYGPNVPPAGYAHPAQRSRQNYQIQRPLNQNQQMWR